MADQPINGLPKKTTVADTDSLLMIGTSEEYQIDYGKLADALLNKLTSKTFTLDQGIKTLIAALNELNSKSFIISLKVEKIDDIVTETYTKILNMLTINHTNGVMNFGIISTVGSTTYISEGLLIYRDKAYFDFTIFSSDLGCILGACVYESNILKKIKLELPGYQTIIG